MTFRFVIGRSSKIKKLIDKELVKELFCSHSAGNNFQKFIKKFLRSINVDIAYVQHGTFEIENSFHSGLETLIEFERVENVRYCYENILSNLLKNKGYDVRTFVRYPSHEKAYNVSKIEKIGITIANDAFKFDHDNTLISQYQRLVSHLKRRGIDIVVRDRNSQLNFIDNIAKDDSKNFSDFADKVDMIFTTKSSICSEAAAKQIPIGIINQSCAPILLPSVVVISPGVSFKYLDEMLNDPSKMEAACDIQYAMFKVLNKT